jgi:hypothetical protein
MNEWMPEPDELPAAVVAMEHNSAAAAVGMSPTRLRQHVRLGDLTPHFSGTKPLYLVADLAKFVAQLPTRPGQLPHF